MSELAASKAMANPLKAFAICCKIWNHPDVLYNFVQKKISEDYDLDLEDTEGRHKGRGRTLATPALPIPPHPPPTAWPPNAPPAPQQPPPVPPQNRHHQQPLHHYPHHHHFQQQDM
ncbi:hypothetical protein O3P69_016564, partial [Scylla paramamosain]